ncbi:MAG: aldolase/citrate lyase family protein [Candidatus Ratteibacteria bacterium]|jgi:2-keto-3-deoxy-L-rhamnonate aldolase RhmA
MEFKGFLKALKEKAQLGFCSMYPAPGIIERIGQDWDWCWIDSQHGQWKIVEVMDAVRVCDLIGIFSMVRVPGYESGTIGKILDTGCHAIMVPMIDTQKLAKEAVKATKFPPLGKRSYGGRRPIDLYGRAYSHLDRPQPLLVCQIESEEALQNIEQIAQVEGVDALFFGPDDLAQHRKIPMDSERPARLFYPEIDKVAETAKKTGKIAAGVFTTSDDLLYALNRGFRLIACSGDVPLLAAGSRTAARNAREIFATHLKERT